MKEFVTGALAFNDIEIVKQALEDFTEYKRVYFDLCKDVTPETKSRTFYDPDSRSTYIIRLNESDTEVEVVYIRVTTPMSEQQQEDGMVIDDITPTMIEVRSSNGK